jgi:hypothetical protein
MTKNPRSGDVTVLNEASMTFKRFIAIVGIATVIHAALAVGLIAIASSRAEREVYGGRLAGHSFFGALGEIGQLLVYPLLLVRGEVTEPRTSILFAANSLLWGIVIGIASVPIVRYRARARSR